MLDGIAASLATGDRAAAERALGRARATSELAVRFQQELELARETTRIAPTHWRSRGDVERYAEAAPHLALAVRNVRVLARHSLAAVETGVTVPPGLPAAARGLARGVRSLERELEEGRGAADAIEAVLDAAGRATLALDESPALPVSVIVGVIRSTAVDVLRALGIDRDEALEHVRAAARRLEA